MKNIYNNIKQFILDLAEKSESFFQTDMKYLAKGGSWLTLGKVVNIATGLVSSIAFANLISKEVYGTYKYVLSIAGVLSVFSLKGYGTAIIQKVARDQNKKVLLPVFKKKLKWSLIGAVAILGVAVYYFLSDNFVLGKSFIVAGSLFPVFYSVKIWSSYLQGRKDFKKTALFGGIKDIVYTLSIVVTIYLTNQVFLIVLVYFASQILANGYFFSKLRKEEVKSRSKELKKEEKEKLNDYGDKLSFLNFFNAFVGQADNLLLWHFLGASEVAIYTFAIKPVMQIKSFLKQGNNLLLPKLSNKNIKDLKSGLPLKSLKFVLVVLTPITIIYFLFSPYLYKVLFPQYISSIEYSQLFAVMILFHGVAPFAKTLEAKKKVKEIYSQEIFNTVVLLSLYLFLIPKFGIWGVLYAKLITESLWASLIFYHFKKL